MGKFVPMIDWQVFQIRAALGMKCWLAVMRQSGLSPWSRQKMLRHNLAAGLTEGEKSASEAKRFAFFNDTNSSAWGGGFLLLNYFQWLYFKPCKCGSTQATKEEAFRWSGFTPDTLLFSFKCLIILQLWINRIKRHILKSEGLRLSPNTGWFYNLSGSPEDIASFP